MPHNRQHRSPEADPAESRDRNGAQRFLSRQGISEVGGLEKAADKTPEALRRAGLRRTIKFAGASVVTMVAAIGFTGSDKPNQPSVDRVATYYAPDGSEYVTLPGEDDKYNFDVTVQPGQSAWSLAQEVYGDTTDIRDVLAGMDLPDVLHPGDSLSFPVSREQLNDYYQRQATQQESEAIVVNNEQLDPGTKAAESGFSDQT